MAASHSIPSTRSLLLSLPTEIRLQILAYLLPYTTLRTSPWNTYDVNTRIPPTYPIWQRSELALLLVNHQLYNDCLYYIFSSNSFLLFVSFNGVQFHPRHDVRVTLPKEAML